MSLVDTDFWICDGCGGTIEDVVCPNKCEEE